jgi:SSS family transporter
MEEYRNVIALSCIGIYFAMCIGVGLWAITRTKDTKDFFMAGRDLGILVTAMAMFSSTLSGFGFVGGPGLVYNSGMSSLWMIVCGTVATCFSFFLVAKRLRIFAEVFDTISLPGAVRARYNSETTRFLTAVAILLGVIGYMAAQTKAMAVVFMGIVNNIDALPEINLEVSLAISVAVLVFYCVTGGIIAGVYTDLVQGIVMVVAGLLVVAAAIDSVDGGIAGAITYMLTDDPESAGPWGTLGAIGCMSWYFLFVMGACGQPHAITKLMMTKRVKDLKNIMALSFTAGTLAVLLWIAIGLAMRSLVVGGELTGLENSNDAAQVFLQKFANPILSGVVFAALFAAIMSTADSFLNIGAAALIHDIPKALIGRSLNNELMWARIATVAIAIGSALFVLYSDEDLVALLGTFGWGTFAAALVPTVAIGLNWKRAPPMAANVAIVSSLAANFYIELSGINVPHGIHGSAIALVLSLTLFFGISLMSKPPKLSKEVEAILDM